MPTQQVWKLAYRSLFSLQLCPLQILGDKKALIVIKITTCTKVSIIIQYNKLKKLVTPL